MKRKLCQPFEKLNKLFDQPFEKVDNPVKKRFFKKILLGSYISWVPYVQHTEYFIIGLDEDNTVHLFDKEHETVILIHDVKDIFSVKDSIHGINLNGKLITIYVGTDDPAGYILTIVPQFEKAFTFYNAYFVTATDKNTYFFLCKGNGFITPIKIPHYLKRIIWRSYDIDDIFYRIYIGIDHNDQFCVILEDNTICSLGRCPEEEMLRLLGDNFEKQQINDMIKELLHGKKEEMVIDCLGKKIDVKMIRDSDVGIAADKDGRVYFSGSDKNKVIDTDNESYEWIESPYFIKVKPKTKKKQQDKLFNLLKMKKNCDLIFF
jgi:hypothetical protein